MKSKKKSKMILVPVFVLALSGCVAALGIANRSNSLSKLNGTAYSRRMDGSIFNWRDNGCSYSLSKGGTVTISYRQKAGESAVESVYRFGRRNPERGKRGLLYFT